MNLLIHNLFTTVQGFKLKKWETLVNPGSEKNSNDIKLSKQISAGTIF